MRLGLKKRKATSLVMLIAVLLATVALGTATLATAADPPALLTTSFVVNTPATMTTQNGYQGVSITFNNTLSAQENVLVYGTLVNSNGQMVSIAVQGSTVASKALSSYFFAFPVAAPGNYKVQVFVTTLDGVPLSVTSSVSVAL